MSAANRDRKNRDPGFQGNPHRARFESYHRTIRLTPSAFWKDHDRPTRSQPLMRSANGRRITNFKL